MLEKVLAESPIAYGQSTFANVIKIPENAKSSSGLNLTLIDKIHLFYF